MSNKVPAMASTKHLAIVVSRFNAMITEKLLEGAIQYLRDIGLGSSAIDTFHVPGAIEIPLVAQKLLQKRNENGSAYYAGVIALGAVIRGETGHYDFVCEQVSQGCLRVSLDYNRPVIFGVLTTDNQAQALARVGGNKGHKGKEAAQAMLEVLSLFEDWQYNE